MQTKNDELAGVADELSSLKARADLLGISYHPSIGVDKLREKVNAAVTKPDPAAEAATAIAEASGKSEVEVARDLRAEAAKLIRIRLQCMNPLKKEWEGEIFSVGNSVVGTFKKYVPFNAEAGWHVPNIIYQHLLQRECQVFVTVTDSRGNKTRKGKMIKEFAIEVLPQLTQEELDELARRQAMAKSVD